LPDGALRSDVVASGESVPAIVSDRMPGQRRAWPGELRVALCVAVVLSIWIVGFASRGHFSGDHGAKLAEADALWASGFQTRALPENTVLDPLGRFFPYGELFRMYRGQHQGIYSIAFCALVAPAVGLFGKAGIPIIPLVATWFTLGLTTLIGRRLGLRPLPIAGALIAVAALTPIGFYAGQLQEHSVAIALIAGALVCLTPDAERPMRPALAGLLLAAAAIMRPECYCALPAGGIALVVARGGRRAPLQLVRPGLAFAAAAVAVLVPFWLINLATAGVWDTVVGQNHGKPHLPWTGILLLFGPGAKRAPIAVWAFAAAAVAAGQIAGWTQHRIARPALEAIAWIAALALLAWASAAQLNERTLTGLFATTPLAALALLRRPASPAARHVLVFSAVFAIQVIALDHSGTAGGLQFGARYLSPLLPGLVLLALGNADAAIRDGATLAARRSGRLALAAAIVVTCGTTAVGWRRAETIARDGAAAAEAAATAGPRVIVTRRPWESQLLAPLPAGGALLNVNGDPTPLLDQLAAAGVTQIVFVARGDLTFRLANGRVARTLVRYPGWLEVQLFTLDGSP